VGKPEDEKMLLAIEIQNEKYLAQWPKPNFLDPALEFQREIFC